MNLNSPVPVRFDQPTTDRLKKVSDRSGISVSKLVRIATEKYLTEVESGNTVPVPMREEPVQYTIKRTKKLREP